MCLSWFPIFLDNFIDNFTVSFLLGKIDKIMRFLFCLLCSAFPLLFNFSTHTHTHTHTHKITFLSVHLHMLNIFILWHLVCQICFLSLNSQLHQRKQSLLLTFFSFLSQIYVPNNCLLSVLSGHIISTLHSVILIPTFLFLQSIYFFNILCHQGWEIFPYSSWLFWLV